MIFIAETQRRRGFGVWGSAPVSTLVLQASETPRRECNTTSSPRLCVSAFKFHSSTFPLFHFLRVHLFSSLLLPSSFLLFPLLFRAGVAKHTPLTNDWQNGGCSPTFWLDAISATSISTNEIRPLKIFSLFLACRRMSILGCRFPATTCP